MPVTDMGLSEIVQTNLYAEINSKALRMIECADLACARGDVDEVTKGRIKQLKEHWNTLDEWYVERSVPWYTACGRLVEAMEELVRGTLTIVVPGYDDLEQWASLRMFMCNQLMPEIRAWMYQWLENQTNAKLKKRLLSIHHGLQQAWFDCKDTLQVLIEMARHCRVLRDIYETMKMHRMFST